VFSTLAAVIATAVFLLPGFVVGDLAQRQRAGSSSLGDQRAVLRALFFSVAIHVVFSAWTWELVGELEGAGWRDEYTEALAYVLVVVVAAPVVAGLALSTLLLGAERGDGTLRWWHYAIGARDARDAWDFAFQRHRETGVWVLVHFRDSAAPAAPRMAIGRYGPGAAFGQSPSPEHDLFLRELWAADEAGQPVAPMHPPRSLWVGASQIAELHLLETPGGAAGPAPPGAIAAGHGREG
jgi:hypothetical protein